MHLHLLQHHPHLGPARIGDWLTSMGHSFTIFHLYDGELVPRPGDCDALIILDDLEERTSAPWLKAERKLIDQALDGQKPLLGLGSGARCIAAALGAPVGRGTRAEIGWHVVHLADDSPFDLPDDFSALLWHRQVFGLPDDALPLGGTASSPVLGFSWDAGRVVGLACHLHHHSESLQALLSQIPPPEGAEPPLASPSGQDIVDSTQRLDTLAPLLDRLLSQWLRSAPAG
ncbi:type 1 glutamine amidotransferase [Halomonas denitrificans]|uniref:type 1 glutamine amidotransferase n=1 Tax=Halomonas denitrificans TaxID=370769 RepID=UPI001C99256C|nr:type 1 glutamine amidotransferase [Halomonas denitrificans]MBY5969873.1 type 1 glutamine amidotransferase [Halomonas denitrificans]